MTGTELSNEQLKRFREESQEYRQGSHRWANVLARRRRAHALICQMTMPDKLPDLSLDDFDTHIWQIGSLRTKNERLDRRRAERLLTNTPPTRFAALLDSGELGFVGNMTWGSAVKTLRSYAHGRSPGEMATTMRKAISLLLHEPGSIRSRLRQVRELRTGFGRNICSGLLMTGNPDEFILYNGRSEEFWIDFGLDFAAGSNWVEAYLRYNAFCRTLLTSSALGLEDLSELDAVIGRPSAKLPAPLKKPRAGRERARQPGTGAGTMLAQIRATKQEMPPDRFRAVWGPLYDRLVAKELSKTTTDIPRAEVGRRAFQHLDEIRAFLQGKNPSTPSSSTLCDWIHFCYALELYREAGALFPFVQEDKVDAAIFRQAKRVVSVCRNKLGG